VATFAVVMGATLVFLGAGVELTRAQGRRDVAGAAARPPTEDLRAPVGAVTPAQAQVAAEATSAQGAAVSGPGATAPQAAVSAPASSVLPRPPIAPASPRAAARKKASAEGEFDHVMDSRK
jgi:hypothetical protein